MPRIFPLPAALAAVIACGVVHGLWTDRWASAEEPAALAVRLASVPLVLGDWQGEDLEQTSRPPREVAAHLFRRYVHRPSGEEVTVALIAGRPGPVSIHTPDACYGARGYEVSTATKFTPAEPSAPAAVFWTAQFLKARPSGRSQLRIFWSWSAGDGWQVPDNPRIAFAGRHLLYKLYLIREAGSPEKAAGADDPGAGLMRLLLPALQKSLFPET